MTGLRARLTHPLAIAGCFGTLAVAGTVIGAVAGGLTAGQGLATGHGLAWPALGLIAGFATSGSV